MFPLLLLRPLLLLSLSSLLSLPSQSSLRVCFYPTVPVGRVRSLSQSKSLTVHRLKSLCARNSCCNCGCFLIFHFFFFTFSLHFVPVLHRLHVFVCEFCRNLVSVCARVCVSAATQTTKEICRCPPSPWLPLPSCTRCRYSHCQNNKSNFFTAAA